MSQYANSPEVLDAIPEETSNLGLTSAKKSSSSRESYSNVSIQNDNTFLEANKSLRVPVLAYSPSKNRRTNFIPSVCNLDVESALDTTPINSLAKNPKHVRILSQSVAVYGRFLPYTFLIFIN